MNELQTNYGTVLIGSQQDIFKKITEALEGASSNEACTVGLTGGSTPKAYYEWCASSNALSDGSIRNVQWLTSDERCVPLDSDESNFGNADRKMLVPLNIADGNKHPWPVDMDPADAAEAFNKYWDGTHSPERAFDLCLLGMGDDCHTASIFPGSPLIHSNPSSNFASVEVPGKGMRLTITPEGLKRCPQIIITVCGAGKVDALKQVFNGDFSPEDKPVQLLKHSKDRVLWLMDEAAGAGLASL